jgi:hypothetical protein
MICNLCQSQGPIIQLFLFTITYLNDLQFGQIIVDDHDQNLLPINVGLRFSIMLKKLLIIKLCNLGRF